MRPESARKSQVAEYLVDVWGAIRRELTERPPDPGLTVFEHRGHRGTRLELEAERPMHDGLVRCSRAPNSAGDDGWLGREGSGSQARFLLQLANRRLVRRFTEFEVPARARPAVHAMVHEQNPVLGSVEHPGDGSGVFERVVDGPARRQEPIEVELRRAEQNRHDEMLGPLAQRERGAVMSVIASARDRGSWRNKPRTADVTVNVPGF